MGLIDRFERIDEVAGNSDDLWFLLFGFLSNLIEIVGSLIAKMDVADCENLVFLLVGFIEAIAGMVEVSH